VELEYILVSHPVIAEAAVFGIPDKVAYESVAAYVVPATGQIIDAQAVQQWVASQMADFAVPRHVRVVDTIPRNRTGKVDKAALRRALLAELENRRATSASA
jgi:acyl-coenzyme A synthetase/AMP-(fatty) acid ligase